MFAAYAPLGFLYSKAHGYINGIIIVAEYIERELVDSKIARKKVAFDQTIFTLEACRLG